jgi:hypothetical protein
VATLALLGVSAQGAAAMTVTFDGGPAKTITKAEGAAGTTTSVSLPYTAQCGLLESSSVSVSVVPVPGTATGGSDYTSDGPQTTGFSCFAGLGGGTGTATATINGDALNEADETFTVKLVDGANAPLDSAGVTVANDDPLPVTTVGAPTAVAEGTGTAGPGLAFPVTLGKPSGRTVSVSYATSDGSATAGTDYTDTHGTVTFQPGETTKTVTVPVTPDSVDEDAETVGLTLSLPPNPVVALGAGGETATGTITDDDTATIVITGASVPEGAAGTVTATNAVVNLSTASAKPVSVFYGTVAGTATEKVDYEAAAGQVTVPAGQRTVNIPLKIIGDALPEADETFSVTIGGATEAAIAPGGATATITIRNDDTAAPATAGTPTAPGSPAGADSSPLPPVIPAATATIGLGKLVYRRTNATMRFDVRCPAAAGRCKGTVTVFTVPVKHSKVKALRTERQLGSKRFDISAGGTLTVSVRLSKKAKAWLKTAKRFPVAAFAVSSSTQAGISTARVKGTLRR